VADWQVLLAYEFPPATSYVLVFLLGSFTVAGLSDLRRLSAQREFLEVWAGVALVMVGVDAWRAWQVGVDPLVLGAKWILVALVGLLSWHRVGVLFRLAAGDVWAIVAVCSLLNPLFVAVFAVLLWVSDRILRPVLPRFHGGGAYPFIPVVAAATLATVALIVLDAGGRVAAALA
jgi:hypothetical protein